MFHLICFFPSPNFPPQTNEITIPKNNLCRKPSFTTTHGVTRTLRNPNMLVFVEEYFQESVGFSGTFNGTPYPYYSHTTPIRIPKDMGIVWVKLTIRGSHVLGSPGYITLFQEGAKKLSSRFFHRILVHNWATKKIPPTFHEILVG